MDNNLDVLEPTALDILDSQPEENNTSVLDYKDRITPFNDGSIPFTAIDTLTTPARTEKFNIDVVKAFDYMSKTAFLAGVQDSSAMDHKGTPSATTWDENNDWNQLGLNKYNPITGKRGTIAHRNNNAGALKMEYKGARLGNVTSTTPRSRGNAVKRAKELYDGVVTLDRSGFIVFKNKEYGKAAQIRLQQRRFKKDTIETMLPKYAVKDGSGNTHHKKYAEFIHNYAEQNGTTLSGKIGNFSQKQLKILTLAMAKVEGGA